MDSSADCHVVEVKLFGNGRNGQRKFTDAEILDPKFPDVRMEPAQHRQARHRFYRKQVADEKRKTALVPYADGWIAILWRLWR